MPVNIQKAFDREPHVSYILVAEFDIDKQTQLLEEKYEYLVDEKDTNL